MPGVRENREGKGLPGSGVLFQAEEPALQVKVLYQRGGIGAPLQSWPTALPVVNFRRTRRGSAAEKRSGLPFTKQLSTASCSS